MKTLSAVRGTVQARRRGGIYLQCIGLHGVLSARAGITCNTAGGKDGIVGEVWRDLPFIHGRGVLEPDQDEGRIWTW